MADSEKEWQALLEPILDVIRSKGIAKFVKKLLSHFVYSDGLS